MPIEIRSDARSHYVAGIVQLHLDYYVPVWGFNAVFGERIEAHVTEFLQRADWQKDLMLTAHQENQLVGSLIIDGSGNPEKGVYLRWFILGGSARGHGLGAQMMERAMAWCASKKFDRRTLSTFRGLSAARKLYEKHGFVLVHETDDDQWNVGVGEQIFEYRSELNDGHAA